MPLVRGGVDEVTIPVSPASSVTLVSGWQHKQHDSNGCYSIFSGATRGAPNVATHLRHTAADRWPWDSMHRAE